MGEQVSIRPEQVNRLALLTERYARFSLSAAGLGNVIGGVLVLAAYLIGALQPPASPWGRLALASTPLLWILSKELLRRRYYQRLGGVRQVWARTDRRWHVSLTVFSTLVAIFVVGSILLAARQEPARLLEPGALGYLLFIAALPFLTWFFMRTPLEFIIGTFLVAQAAVIVAGGNYALGEQLQAPIAALVLIWVGFRQHREFLELRRELAVLRAGE